MMKKMTSGTHQSLKAVILVTLLLLSNYTQAGGGPETTLIVVNANSPYSKAIANYYRNLRDIPSNHVLYLNNIPDQIIFTIADFRRKVLWPIYQYLIDEQLFDHIDTIAYSADFPYAVNFSTDAQLAGFRLNKYTGNAGSLTGLTYFFSQVLEGDLSYLSLYSHGYFRQIPNPRLDQLNVISQDDAALLQQAQSHHGKKEYQQAADILNQFTARNSNHINAHYLLAKSLARLKLTNQALKQLQRAILLGWHDKSATLKDPDLKLLSALPQFIELIKSIKPRPVNLRPTEGFNSAKSWRYIKKIQGQKIQIETISPAEREKTTKTLALQPAARPKMMLSTMLAYTGLRGNGLEEVYDYLKRAASSDGTAPPGTVYLMTNKDVRTKTRFPVFESLIGDMQEANRKAEIIQGVLPESKTDIIGLVAGARKFNWANSNSKLLPGTIAEALTSYGGDFKNTTQTKLTEFLRQGAAGSSGAVREPFSIWHKFPSPYIHYHYAKGSSLVEAFYQSVATPYQLLIVGDPLTRPFANFAQVAVLEDLEGTALKGITTITPMVITPSIIAKRLELWVDGKMLASSAPGRPFVLDTRLFPDGQHELRIVAVDNGSLETRAYKKCYIIINNLERPKPQISEKISAYLGDDIILNGSLQGTDPSITEVRLTSGSRRLASIPATGGRWLYRLPSELLGVGLSEIQLHYYRTKLPVSTTVRTVHVLPPKVLPPTQKDFTGTPGLLVTVTNENGIDRSFVQNSLNGKRTRYISAYDRVVRYQGKLKVDGTGLHQLKIFGNARYKFRIGEKTFENKSNNNPAIALNLRKGWYDIEIINLGQADSTPGLVLSSPKGAIILDDDSLQH